MNPFRREANCQRFPRECLSQASRLVSKPSASLSDAAEVSARRGSRSRSPGVGAAARRVRWRRGLEAEEVPSSTLVVAASTALAGELPKAAGAAKDCAEGLTVASSSSSPGVELPLRTEAAADAEELLAAPPNDYMELCSGASSGSDGLAAPNDYEEPRSRCSGVSAAPNDYMALRARGSLGSPVLAPEPSLPLPAPRGELDEVDCLHVRGQWRRRPAEALLQGGLESAEGPPSRRRKWANAQLPPERLARHAAFAPQRPYSSVLDEGRDSDDGEEPELDEGSGQDSGEHRLAGPPPGARGRAGPPRQRWPAGDLARQPAWRTDDSRLRPRPAVQHRAAAQQRGVMRWRGDALRQPALDPPDAFSSALPLPAAPPPGPLHPGVLAEGRLLDFWSFVANALLAERSLDNICRVFELGGSIDILGDVAFTRDHITKPCRERKDLESLVWHCLLISWLGAGGPNQDTYKGLVEMGFARPYRETGQDTIHEIYDHVEQLASLWGPSAVFHGDSRAVRFRLDVSQGERVLHAWHEAVPRIVEALQSGISPQALEQVLRRTFYIGELTAKELFVHLSYAWPTVADTRCHVPIGDGARSGARLILEGEVEEAPRPQGRGRPAKENLQARRERDMQAVRLIAASRDDYLRQLPELGQACREYQSTAQHRNDPFRNARVVREHLLDLADVEVMLCFYKNYCKLRARLGARGAVPRDACPRGWTRRDVPPQDGAAVSAERAREG